MTLSERIGTCVLVAAWVPVAVGLTARAFFFRSTSASRSDIGADFDPRDFAIDNLEPTETDPSWRELDDEPGEPERDEPRRI